MPLVIIIFAFRKHCKLTGYAVALDGSLPTSSNSARSTIINLKGSEGSINSAGGATGRDDALAKTNDAS